jgi:WD40 repeat protein
MRYLHHYVVLIFLTLLYGLPLVAFAQQDTITSDNAAQIRQSISIPRQGKIVNLGFEWSPDGDRIAIAGDSGIRILHRGDREIQPVLMAGDGSSERTVAYHPSGELIASSDGTENTVTLWSPRDGTALATLDAGDLVEHIAFSPDGFWLAIANFKGEISLWAARTRNGLIQTLRPNNAYRIRRYLQLDHSAYVRTLVFTPDSRFLVTGDSSQFIRFWSVGSGEEVTFQAAGSVVLAAAVSKDGRWLAYSSATHLFLWDLQNMKRQGSIDTPALRDLSFNSDGSVIASISNTNELLLWNVDDILNRRDGSTPLFHFQSDDVLIEVAFSPNGQYMGMLGFEELVLWSINHALSYNPTPFSLTTTADVPTETPSVEPVEGAEISAGQLAQVQTTKGDTLNLRAEAGRDFEIITRMENGTLVTVLEGPQIIDGLNWWRLRIAEGIEGWAVDFVDGEQTLIPVPNP